MSVIGLSHFGSKLDVSGGDVTGTILQLTPAIGAAALRVISNDSNATVDVRGPAGTSRQVIFRTGIDVRWIIRADAAPETGSNSGTRFTIIATDDAGVNTTIASINRDDYQTTLLGVGTNTTATAGNVNVTTGGILRRSTSSIKYKTDVETLEDDYADKLFELRPVWYRSTVPSDNSEWSHYGLIAEEVAQVDPRLVQFAEQENGTVEPEGVQYDRLVPHLINLVQRQQAQIDALTARLDAAGI
jgi:hypothetical protein